MIIILTSEYSKSTLNNSSGVMVRRPTVYGFGEPQVSTLYGNVGYKLNKYTLTVAHVLSNFMSFFLHFFFFKYNLGHFQLDYLIKKKYWHSYKKFNLNHIIRTNLNFFSEQTVFIVVFRRWKSRHSLTHILYNRFRLGMSQVIYLSLISGDPKLLVIMLVGVLNMQYFLLHRMTFRKITNIILMACRVYKLLIGFWVILVGKVSVSGNARTRVVQRKFELTSSSKSWLRGMYCSDIVHTFTGCLGINMLFVS